MKPRTVGASVAFALVANPLIGSFLTAKECPKPAYCFDLKADIQPHESHVPGTYSVTTAMNFYQNIAVQVVDVRWITP
jgi:hypothetical protein